MQSHSTDTYASSTDTSSSTPSSDDSQTPTGEPLLSDAEAFPDGGPIQYCDTGIEQQTLLQGIEGIDLFELVNYMISKSSNIGPPSVLPRASEQFYSTVLPDVSITRYASTFFRFSRMESTVAIAALIYLERFLTKADDYLNKFNAHRLLGIALIQAHKFYVDNPLRDGFLARVAGISLQEMKRLEVQFLSELKNNHYISQEEFLKTVRGYNTIFKARILPVFFRESPHAAAASASIVCGRPRSPH